MENKTAPECERAGELMMKYMDGELTEREILKLREHLEVCPACKEDFITYDFIHEELSQGAGLISPPDGFVKAVMTKVSALPSPKKIAAAAFDTKLRTLWAVISALFGVAFLLVWYKDPILSYMSGISWLSGYVGAIIPAVDRLYGAAASFFSNISAFAMTALDFISAYKYVFFAGFCVLCGVQFFISRRRAAAGKARDKA
ncbi:MAG: zf-HC2 domain-containing protein [Clostridiales bacterium]|nr:zf-HC2 domain-containing protein [Clostridiales bacterium]